MKEIFDESLQRSISDVVGEAKVIRRDYVKSLFNKSSTMSERCPTPLREGNVYNEHILIDVYLAFPVQVKGVTQSVLDFEIWNQTEIREYYIMERLDEGHLMCYLRYNK